MNDKNYEVETAPETPFPTEVVTPIASSQQPTTAGNYSPTTSKEKTMPKKRVAVELLSTALNTRSRKVLQEFQLTQSGGFQIGDFKEGISGDVRITPNGLTGRNIAGLVTFALDTDGNLVLVGELRSGSVVSGQVLVGNNSIVLDGENKRMVFYDDAEIPVIVIGNA